MNKNKLTTYTVSGKKEYEQEISINNAIFSSKNRYLVVAEKKGKKAAEEAKKKGASMKGRRAYIGEKTRRMEKRRKNLENREERAIEEKSGLLKNLETTEDLKLFPLQHYKDVPVSLSDVCIYYEGTDGMRKNLGSVNFEVRNGECVVLSGKNGCGKSSVLKAVIQAVAPRPGEMWK